MEWDSPEVHITRCTQRIYTRTFVRALLHGGAVLVSSTMHLCVPIISGTAHHSVVEMKCKQQR